MKHDDWINMSNEQLCVLYKQTRDDELFEYFLSKNYGLMIKFLHSLLCKMPDKGNEIIDNTKYYVYECMLAYDPTKQVAFSTYFYYYIKKAVSCYFRDNPQLIHTPAWLYFSRHSRLENAEVLELAQCTSLDSIVDTNQADRDDTLLDNLKNPDALTGDQYIDTVCDKKQLSLLLDKLDPRSKIVIDMYYGISTGVTNTLSDIGRYFGVSRERIRQICVKAIRRLRRIAHLYVDRPKYVPTSELDDKYIHIAWKANNKSEIENKNIRHKNKK